MHFEKATFTEFSEALEKYGYHFTLDEIVTIHGQIRLPERATRYSAGYDFFVPFTFYLNGGNDRVIPSGIKVGFEWYERAKWHLQLYTRSSLGIHNKIVLTHGTGIIDADYTGVILIPLHNQSNEGKRFEAGDKIIQGVFQQYGIANDDAAIETRTGGVGSTGR